MEDVSKGFHTIRFWIFEVGVGAGLALWAQLWQPEWVDEGLSMTLYQALVPIAGVSAGLFLLVLVAAVAAPYRQRDRADELIGLLQEEIDELRDSKPRISVVVDSEQRMMRLNVRNEGASASFSAMGRIVEHDGSTPWPIQWRHTENATLEIFEGDGRILNIASGIDGGDGTTDVRFLTATQPHRSGHGISVEGQSLVSREFLLSELPADVTKNNVLTIEVSITANPSMEIQPCRTSWHLIRGNGAVLDFRLAD